MRRLKPAFNLFAPRYWFGEVDSRPLSLFRVLFALLLLKDAVYHFPLAGVFYSDDGLLPRSVLTQVERYHRFSIMDAMAAPWQAQLTFVAWGLVLLALLLGWHSRLMSILNFLLIMSIHERNSFVIDGSDNVARILSFWLIFLPLGNYYALDALRRRWRAYRQSHHLLDLQPGSAPRTAFAFPLRMIQLQVAMVYLFTFILKLPGEIWLDGHALHYALQIRSLTLPSGDWVYQHLPRPLLQGMTYLTLFTEASFLPFVFSPLLQPYLRLLALTLGIAFHLGVALLMSIPNFSAMMIVSYTLFLLPAWVLALEERLKAPRRRLLMPLLPAGSPLLPLLSLLGPHQVMVGAGAALKLSQKEGADSWWVVDPGGRQYQGQAAWQEVAAHLPLSRGWAWMLRWGWLRRVLWLGLTWLSDAMALPAPQPEQARYAAPALPRGLQRLGRGLMALLLGGLMLTLWQWNLAGVQQDGEPLLPPVEGRRMALVQYLSIGQHWSMFSPYPSTRDGWISVPGVFEDGSRLDLRTQQPVDDDEAMRRILWGPPLRWKKYEENLFVWEQEALLFAMGSYYCRAYNQVQQRPEGERLATLELIYHWRDSVAPEAERGPFRYQSYRLWRHWCYEEYAY